MAAQFESGNQGDTSQRTETALPGSRRRRSFLASSGRAPEPIAELPSLQSLVDDEDDVPVLTEIVVEEPAAEPQPAPSEEALLSILASDLVHTLEQQLAIELPTLIEATLLNAQNELRDGINSTLDMALRDFLARRQQLSLPLEESNRDR